MVASLPPRARRSSLSHTLLNRPTAGLLRTLTRLIENKLKASLKMPMPARKVCSKASGTNAADGHVRQRCRKLRLRVYGSSGWSAEAGRRAEEQMMLPWLLRALKKAFILQMRPKRLRRSRRTAGSVKQYRRIEANMKRFPGAKVQIFDSTLI